MQCPKCGAALEQVPAGFAAAVHRCSGCHGIACNDDALADLQRQWFLWPKQDPREIDPGRARDGRRWNEMTAVPCPSCGREMTTIAAEGQAHIRLERCAPCQLTFFDAGEITDLRYETLADTFRGLLARWRKGA